MLHRLLMLEGQRLSYRTLDVEQIGSVYEALMGYHVIRATERMVCLKPEKAKLVWVSATELHEVPKAQRPKWLKEEVGLSKALATKLATASSKEREVDGTMERLRDFGLVGKATAEPSRLLIQPGSERRKSSSHYTPRSLSAPIVARTLEPLIRVMGDVPASERLLNLKVCNPAMGSGAFLVEAIALRQKILDLAAEGVGSTREKYRLLQDAEDALKPARLIGDLVVGAFFSSHKDKDREKERHRRLQLLESWLASGDSPPEELLELQRAIHEQLPVFHAERPDPLDENQINRAAQMDAFIGNPPFAGKNAIAEIGEGRFLGRGYPSGRDSGQFEAHGGGVASVGHSGDGPTSASTARHAVALGDLERQPPKPRQRREGCVMKPKSRLKIGSYSV